MPWLAEHLTLRLHRMSGIYSVRLVCERCGQSYLLQAGMLHQLAFGDMARLVLATEELHEKVCPAK